MANVYSSSAQRLGSCVAYDWLPCLAVDSFERAKGQARIIAPICLGACDTGCMLACATACAHMYSSACAFACVRAHRQPDGYRHTGRFELVHGRTRAGGCTRTLSTGLSRQASQRSPGWSTCASPPTVQCQGRFDLATVRRCVVAQVSAHERFQRAFPGKHRSAHQAGLPVRPRQPCSAKADSIGVRRCVVAQVPYQEPRQRCRAVDHLCTDGAHVSVSRRSASIIISTNRSYLQLRQVLALFPRRFLTSNAFNGPFPEGITALTRLVSLYAPAAVQRRGRFDLAPRRRIGSAWRCTMSNDHCAVGGTGAWRLTDSAEACRRRSPH